MLKNKLGANKGNVTSGEHVFVESNFNHRNVHIDFYEEVVKQKQPILIKNFVDSCALQQLINNNKTQMKPSYGRGAVPFLYLYFDNTRIRDYLFSLPLIKNLAANSNTQFREKMRFWQHNKGNISNFHYDQRSTDLLNLCVSGAKKWLFLAPEAPIKCWPFYNIALPFQQKVKAQALTITMAAGDLLYIPRNWYHQVETLEDNTQNINVIFNDLADSKMQTREQELAAFRHLLIPNYVYGDDIEVLTNTIKSVSKRRIANRLIKEILFLN